MALSLVTILKPWRLPVRARLVDDSEWFDWDYPLFAPVPSYIETGKMGPVSIREVACIEINPVEIQKTGRLIPDREIDRTADLTAALDEARFDYRVKNGIVCLTFERANQRLQLTGDARG